ncbi:hypothetical protein [Acinetobacter sp.]|uniref:hypothetical protein n=1 Tax=Acinetobacter sp. TaxID=472 RepID=UPI003CFC904B
MAAKRKSVIDYKPDIKPTEKRVTGDLSIDIKTPEKSQIDPVEAAEIAEYKEMLTDALAIDDSFKQIRQEMERQSKDLSIKIPVDEFPSLSEAIERLSDGRQNDTIDYQTFDKAMKILANATTLQYGFEPTQLLFAESGPHGPILPKTTFPETMDCNDAANLDLPSMQSETENQPVEAAIDQRQRATQLSLLATLFKMLLAFIYKLAAKILKKTKLEKVPVAGSMVKKIRKKLEKEADKLMNWIKKGQKYDTDDADMSDLLGDLDSLTATSATDCIGASARVVKHTLTWAANEPMTNAADGASPKAILLRPIVDREQASHEVTKFQLSLNVPVDLQESDEVEQLEQNTGERADSRNRYFNRSVTDFRG